MTDDLKKLEEDIRSKRIGQMVSTNELGSWADRLKAIREQPDDLEEILAEIIKTIDVMSDASRTASNAATKRIEALEAAQKQLLHRAAPENWEKRLKFDPKAICDAVDANRWKTCYDAGRWWVEVDEFHGAIPIDEAFRIVGVNKCIKADLLEREKQKVIAQMDKMIAEALHD